MKRFFLEKGETESRFDQLLKELCKDRERQDRKWEEEKAERKKLWEESEKKWEKQDKK